METGGNKGNRQPYFRAVDMAQGESELIKYSVMSLHKL